jgi:hypothetical protein
MSGFHYIAADSSRSKLLLALMVAVAFVVGFALGLLSPGEVSKAQYRRLERERLNDRQELAALKQVKASLELDRQLCEERLAERLAPRPLPLPEREESLVPELEEVAREGRKLTEGSAYEVKLRQQHRVHFDPFPQTLVRGTTVEVEGGLRNVSQEPMSGSFLLILKDRSSGTKYQARLSYSLEPRSRATYFHRFIDVEPNRSYSVQPRFD